MTREQIQVILKSGHATMDKDGHTLPEGSSVTFHVAHSGGSLSFAKLETVRFDGELIFAKSAKQTVAIVMSDVFAVALEGGTEKARRPAGFASS